MVDGVQIVGKNEIKFFNGDYASEKGCIYKIFRDLLLIILS